MSNYFSFLICHHPGHTDIFISGSPVGVIRNGVFEPHKIITLSGNLREVTMKDFSNLVTGACPFQTMDVLKIHLLKTVEDMQLTVPISA